ncbi:MAG: ABC transporter ATP-binding protein [Syntrophales bacterium]|jgi:branched-chain amino acid transport system ATP-binding protein|nr:ABC transporter ATP-binding protein [Syntrophales bacterium]
MPILEGQGVTEYFGGLTAVSSVDFHVEKNETVGLIGPNGAGKTTLFNLISGALSPKSGSIKFKGQDIAGVSPYKICRMGVARTFQTVKVFANMSVLDNVMLGSYFGISPGLSSADAVAKASEILAFVGLSGAILTPARDLTLSNQKRLEVARALATDPELILLDEIMAGLNQTEVVQAMDLITRIRCRGITIIMIEHVMKAIMNLCGRIIVLHHGSKIAEGTPEEIAVCEEVIKVYLGDKARVKS